MKAKIDKRDLGYEEVLEEDGFIGEVSGLPVASFDFNEDSSKDLVPKVPAPSLIEECFNIKRTYKIRESTARMLNEIKAVHPDVNVYMNTIVDAALRHYYDFIFMKIGDPS